MKNNHYIYTTKEISRYYGLTGKGLAYYEDKGIISPMRTENNKYRIFTLADCYNLYHSKLYANCGFTLKETADLLQHEQLEDTIQLMNLKADSMRKNIQQQERTLFHVQRIIDTIQRYHQEHFYEIVDSPEFYRLFVRKYNQEHVASVKQSEEFEAWNAIIPVNSASLKIPFQILLSDEEEFNVDIGNIISKNDFELFEFKLSNQVEYLPSRKCLHTIVKGDSEKINTKEWLIETQAYMHKHNLTCIADPFTSMLMVTNENKSKIRYDEIWIPIE